jgi:2-oxoglutarate dehydrogenase E2 component (dihydrolipoamide succinyltransferase)
MIPIKVPPLGESITEATIGRWLKNEGDAVQTGDTLVELETDKINVEVPAQKSGVLSKRMKNEGDVVKVDETLGEIDESATAGGGAAKPAPKAEEKPAVPKAAPQASAAAPAPSTPKGQAPEQPGKTAPAARRMAAEENIDLSKVQGTGRDGTVSKSDVIEQKAAGSQSAAAGTATPPARSPQPAAPARPQPAPGTRETREKMTTRRKKIAEHLLEAKNATASLTTFNEVDMTALNQIRDKFKEKVEKEQGVKLTFMPFFVRAACMALKQFPVVNAEIDGDSSLYKHYVNMGIAVASEQGLVVPNVKDADLKGMLDISRDIAAIAKRARDNKLTMEDLTGGTFTITNGGVFGSLVSTPILNYPQVAILGLHKIQDRPIAMNGEVVIRPMMYIALTYDHRIIDGQQAVLFLVRIKELMEEPAAMLIE